MARARQTHEGVASGVSMAAFASGTGEYSGALGEGLRGGCRRGSSSLTPPPLTSHLPPLFNCRCCSSSQSTTPQCGQLKLSSRWHRSEDCRVRCCTVRALLYCRCVCACLGIVVVGSRSLRSSRLVGFRVTYPACSAAGHQARLLRLLRQGRCVCVSLGCGLRIRRCGSNCCRGCWLLVAGCWLLVAGCWLLVAGCWLLLTHAGYFSYCLTSPVSRSY